MTKIIKTDIRAQIYTHIHTKRRENDSNQNYLLKVLILVTVHNII